MHKMREELAGAFSNTHCLILPLALFRRWRGRAEGALGLPQDLPPRSPLASVVRTLGYWLVYYTAGYRVSIRPALARSGQVIHDDAWSIPSNTAMPPGVAVAVDLALVPKPDLIILLDASANLLQTRKQELPFERTAEQVDAYRKLIRTLPKDMSWMHPHRCEA
jgi:hypothetical protein